MSDEQIEITGQISQPTAAAILTLLREDIAVLRSDNRQQHSDIVRRLDTLNGRVHKHDREIGDITAKVAAIKDVADTVHHIDQNYLGKTAAWTGFTFIVGGMGAVLFWLLEHVTLVP